MNKLQIKLKELNQMLIEDGYNGSNILIQTLEKIREEAINYTRCCKSDSELLTSFAEYLKERDILTTKRENIPVRVDLFLKRG